jgi:hypothetical protein
MLWHLLNNVWFAGIGTGVVSGVLVTVISRYLLSNKDSREYQQKLRVANREIVYAIRPGISEGLVPDRIVILALRQSTARRSGLIAEDLYSSEMIAEELIKEVMDSSFLSADKKSQYCGQLIPLTLQPPLHPPHSPASLTAEVTKTREFKEYRGKVIEATSMIMGIFAGLISAIFGIVDFLPQVKGLTNNAFKTNSTLVLLTVFAALGSVMFSMMVTLLKTKERDWRQSKHISISGKRRSLDSDEYTD